jgi:prepilin signal peptidase PulO-like enzyme (type II secretory pathway)
LGKKVISTFTFTYCGNVLPVYSIAEANIKGVAISSDIALTALMIAKVAALLSYLIAGCCWDFKSHTLPNRLNYSFLGIALLMGLAGSVLTTWQSDTLTVPKYALTLGISESVAGAVICFLFTFICWRLGAIGGGDVKLAAVLGAFLGPWGGIMALVICHILAMVTVTLDTASRYIKAIRLKQLPTYSQLQGELKREIPMAGFYSVGVVGYLLGGIAL